MLSLILDDPFVFVLSYSAPRMFGRAKKILQVLMDKGEYINLFDIFLMLVIRYDVGYLNRKLIIDFCRQFFDLKVT